VGTGLETWRLSADTNLTRPFYGAFRSSQKARILRTTILGAGKNRLTGAAAA